MQGSFIFIQLLLAEGQEQNSDLTGVYIIFIQKSIFFIHPKVFPISDSFAGSPRGQTFLAFKRTGLRENFLRLLAERKNAGISRKRATSQERRGLSATEPLKDKTMGNFFLEKPNGKRSQIFPKILGPIARFLSQLDVSLAPSCKRKSGEMNTSRPTEKILTNKAAASPMYILPSIIIIT